MSSRASCRCTAQYYVDTALANSLLSLGNYQVLAFYSLCLAKLCDLNAPLNEMGGTNPAFSMANSTTGGVLPAIWTGGASYSTPEIGILVG